MGSVGAPGGVTSRGDLTIFRTADAGGQWSKSDGGFFAGFFLGFAEDPSDPDHLVASSMTALERLPGVYESYDRGRTWGEIDALRTHAVMSLAIDPRDSNVMLAGTFAIAGSTQHGIFRTTTGASGLWSQRLASNVRVNSFARDTVHADIVYAMATDAASPEDPSSVGLYLSRDGGASWSKSPVAGGMVVAPRPGMAGHAVAVGTDAFATTDAFLTVPVPLGLADVAPGEVFSAVAFAAHDSNTLLAGTTSGRLFLTTAFSPSMMEAADWRELETPFVDAIVVDIEAAHASRWYAIANKVDIEFSAKTRQGLIRSIDRGASWSFIKDEIGSSHVVWSLTPSVHDSSVSYLGMWGRGLLKLVDR
jgi:hypothetical protein